MSNLIPLEDAARMLGLSVEKLSEMRSNSEIFGYKDGASWKFKMQEIERVADEFDLTLTTGAGVASDDLSLSVDEDDGFQLSDSADLVIDDDDSLEIDMANAPTVTPGGDSELKLAGDDDSEELMLSHDSEIDLADDHSGSIDTSGEGTADLLAATDQSEELMLSDDSEIRLADDEDAASIAPSGEGTADLLAADPNELSFGSSDIKLASDADAPSAGDSGPATNELLQDFEDDGDLLMSEDDLFEDDLVIQESHEDSFDLSSDFESSDDVIIESDSSAESAVLEVSEDSDFSLSDSGLVELAEDSDDMIVLDEPAPLEDATQLGDDDFNLTPVEEAMEMEDGSQVIALEDADMYDEASATLLSPSDEMEAAPMLTEDAMAVDDFGAFDAGAMTAGAIPGAPGALPESPYTVWQVASLGLVTALLGFGGIVAYDLARNLWLPQDQIITGGLLPSIVSLFGG